MNVPELSEPGKRKTQRALAGARRIGGKAVGAYAGILGLPGTRWFSISGALARLPMSMVTLSIILLITARYGEYSLAGQVAACYVVAQALGSPQLAKYIDRYGQARIMRPSLLIATAALIGLLVAANLRANQMWLFLTSAIAGMTIGSIGALVRSRWTKAVSNARELHVAFALESAIDELLFVIGPVLATVLATQISPNVGLIVAICASVIGGFWFLALRATEPEPLGSQHRGKQAGRIMSFTLIAIALVFLSMGVIFGAADVSTVAFAEDAGKAYLSGVVLGIFALGSLLAGLWFGASHFTGPLWRRFIIGVVILAVCSSLFVFAASLWVLSLAMFVAGFSIAPTIITGNAIVQSTVPSGRLTEGLAWAGTSIGLGFALGSSLAGQIIDAGNGHDGFFVVMVAAGAAALISLSSMPILKRSVGN